MVGCPSLLSMRGKKEASVGVPGMTKKLGHLMRFCSGESTPFTKDLYKSTLLIMGRMREVMKKDRTIYYSSM